MHISDLSSHDIGAIEQAAFLLVDGFKENWPDAWPDMTAAMQEVQEFFADDRICRVAKDESGTVIGWVGGICQYDGHVWELHPLVVNRDWRGQGIGRALVEDFEAQVGVRGGLTIWLGTDDESNQTTLGGVDLYPNICEHIANIQNLGHHPYEFYQKLGFVIVGVMPDANGWGKPDIFMAKRVER